ncbi:hypothetical protein MBLNU230_g4819t1 [Neophaeotheca triangularis]
MFSQSFSLLALTAPVALAQTHLPLSNSLQNILSHAQSGPLYTYPTDLTQGIIPKPFHSHNDYWRPVPFYSALSVGAISVEADVFLHNNATLLVGHEESALTTVRTFESLYIDPILSVLNAQNPSSPFVTTENLPTRNGVYDTAAGQTLYLFVDLKTPGPETWPLVVAALQPLREAGYLTTYNGSAIVPGPVTVIGTGNTPLDQIASVSPRDYFYDASLPLLTTEHSNITAEISPIASTAFTAVLGDFRGLELNSTQLEVLADQVGVARERGIGVRYWDQPGFPIGTRNAVWRQLWEAGVELLNVDDLEGAAGFWEGSA